MINRDNIREIVEVFYQPTFKTFYVNSIDGQSFIKSIGVFVSLGITTSMKVLEDMRNVIVNNGNYNATIAEISSRKVAGQFLNTITNLNNPQQYKLDSFANNSNILNEENAKEELLKMKSLMNTEQDLKVLQSYAPKVSKLQDLINKLTENNSWDLHMIQKDPETNDYKIFHKFVNYKKDDSNVEYRIGIFVSEKE